MPSATLPDFLYEDYLRTSGIYAIACSGNGRVYIGSGVNLSLRWRKHYRELIKGHHHNLPLQRSWAKYGPESFTFSVLEYVPLDHLIEREQYHLSSRDIDTLFNLSPSAGSILGFKQSPETCELMRRQRLGIQVHTEETKARLSERFKGIVRRQPGWKMTEEQKRQLSIAHTGKPLSAEHIAKVALTSKGRIHTPEAKAKITASKTKFTPEQVTEIRDVYQSKRISITDIANELGVSWAAIARMI
jgi:group I intron endonuclease